MLPQLYSIEFINLKGSGSLNEKDILRELHSYLSDSEAQVDLAIMRFRFSSMDLSQQMPAIILLIERCFKSLIDIDLSWSSLTLENTQDLLKCLMKQGYEAAEQQGARQKGQIRSLNLSFNSCLMKGCRSPDQGKKKKKRKKRLFEESSGDDDT